MTKNVCFLLYEHANFLSFGLFLEAFSALELISTPEQRPTYKVVLASYSGGQVAGPFGMSVETISMAEVSDQPFDTYIICGGWGFESALNNRELIRLTAEQGGRARRLCVLGGGVFLAAAAGLLDGRQVATHPIVADRLRERFPDLNVDSNALLVRDGDVFTSPGMSSCADLALSLIEWDHGYSASIEVAKFLVLYVKRSFHDKQVSSELVLQGKSDKFGPLHDWIRSNLRKELSLEILAQQSGMSVRNFTRVYQREMGISPRKSVEVIRVHAACRMLTLGRDQTPMVAHRCGFDSERTFLRAFTRIIGISPSQFREFARQSTRAPNPYAADLAELLRRAANPADDKPPQT